MSMVEAPAKVLYVVRDPGDVTRNPGIAWAHLRSGMTTFSNKIPSSRFVYLSELARVINAKTGISCQGCDFFIGFWLDLNQP
jgi:hypothetical protein